MNDFTKEELENILNGNVELYPSTYQALRDKVQIMIDNYCEHSWVFSFSANGSCVKCVKCNKEIN